MGTAGESCVSHESCDAPSPSRFPSTIFKGGVEGDPVKREIEQGIDIRQSIGRLDDDGQRGAITVKSTLAGRGVKTKGLASPEELVLPSSKSRIADDLDSGQEPPSSREEPAMCGLLTMRGLLAEQLFTVHEPFTTNGLDGGQEPPSSKEEQQGGTGRDIDIGDIDSTTETESGAARMPATEEPCAPTLASDSGDYDFSYNFKISDMSTIMKDKGLRLGVRL